MENKLKVQLIDLYGYSTGIKKKDNNSLIFYFNDFKYGHLVVTAERDCILYYQLLRDKEYHLRAVLKGLSFKRNDGQHITKNCLVIKEAKEMGDNQFKNDEV